MRMRFSKAMLAVVFAATGTSALAAEAWRATGFQTPESVAFDGENERFIVSNIVGDAMQVDGQGTLSLLAVDGQVIDADWVTGLDAPKGIAVGDGKAYVADLTKLRIVDLASGAVETVDVVGATFLNDVAIGPDGAVYVSDTFANAVYRYQGGSAELWLQDPTLLTPNGLLVDGNTLVVASFGTLSEDPANNKPGGLFMIDLASKAITKDEVLGDFGALDGLVKVGDAYYATDFFSGTIYRAAPGSKAEAFATLKLGTADLGTDGTTLVVPQMMEGEVVGLTLVD